MWSRTAPNFEEAHARERELNPRQLEVLKLIERGHTNREIADLLGLTVDGAKWNVSEILTKLGLDSREEAAEYWSWRNGPLTRVRMTLRGMFALPSAKWVGAATATGAVAVALVVAELAFRGSAPTSGGVSAFYLEARESIAVVVGPEEPREAILRWWYLDENHYRQEYERILPWFAGGTNTEVANGSETRHYSREMNLYSVRPTEPLASYQRLRPTPIIMIGPAPASSLTGLIEILSHWGEGTEQSINGVVSKLPKPPPPVEVGRDVLVGRDVVIIEYVQGTLWVDPDAMLIVKHVSGHFTAEVTRFEEEPAFGAKTFEFERPAGSDDEASMAARATNPTGGQPAFMHPEDWLVHSETSTRIIKLNGLTPGVFAPGFLPDGWEWREGSGGGRSIEWVFRPPGWNEPCCNSPLDGDYIRIEQSRGMTTVPDSVVPGNPYERIANPRGAVSRTRLVGDTVIRVSASGSGASHLDSVAESMTPAP